MLLQELFETTPAEERFYAAAIEALKRRLASKGDKESVGSAAFEIGRSFGIPASELVRMYREKGESNGN